jgi:hypothetical protein
MAGLTPDIPSTPQQFHSSHTLQVEPQMQQMAAMMSMAAAGMTNNSMVMNGAGDLPLQGFGAGTGVSTMPAPSMATAPAVSLGHGQMPDASVLAAAAAAQQLGAPPMPSAFPGMDPSLTQVYAQMFTSYLQQAYAGLGPDTGMASAASFPAAPPLPNYSVGAPAPAAIAVSVEGMKFQYQLTDDDLQKVFSRYGSVTDIKVDEVGTQAIITFGDFSYAQAAMNDLNGKVLNGLEGTLRISWASAPGQQLAAAAPYPVMPPFPGGWGFPGNTAWPSAPASGLGMLGGGLGEVPAFPPSPLPPTSPGSPGTPPPNNMHANNITPDGKPPAHVKGVRKYTCRFLIGIENDKDFQVVRRIIGAKGSNMKRIVKQSEAKLRLRGVGSGYFEGAGQKESNEPLQLCVSCTSPDGYRTAVSLVEELLEGVYTEYRAFCRETGRPEVELQAVPQLVSSGRDRTSGAEQLFPEGGSPGLPLQMGDDDEDDDLPGLSAKREGGRKRGRRSRGKKSEGGKVEKGEPPRNAPMIEEIQQLIDQRNEARRQCNFAEADRIRQSLHERGVALMDEPGGRGKASEVTTWRYWRE